MVYRKAYQKVVSVRKAANPAMQTASRALAIASKVAKALNVEKKYHDVVVAGQFGDNGQVTLLNGIAQGDTASTRDGDQVKALKLYWKGNIANDNTSNSYLFRFIIFQDRQADGTAPTITEVLQTANPRAPLNMDNKLRFKVLHDKFFMLQSKSAASNDLKALEGYMDLSKIYKKAQGMRSVYGGTGATTGDINSNSLWCLAISNNSTDTEATTNIYFRLRYVDN